MKESHILAFLFSTDLNSYQWLDEKVDITLTSGE